MNPTPAEPAKTLREVNRLVLCRTYGACLDAALLRGWPGFTCERCEDFEFEGREDPDWWKAQAEKASTLLLFAGYLPRRLIESVKNIRKGQSRKAKRREQCDENDQAPFARHHAPELSFSPGSCEGNSDLTRKPPLCRRVPKRQAPGE